MWKNIEYIKDIIKNSINKTDVLNKLGLKNNGGNFNTLTTFIKKNEIDISHFQNNKSTKKPVCLVRSNLDEILTLNSFKCKSSRLKEKLYKEGLKVRLCELCGQNEEWLGRRMSLILDHINGDRYDNRIENLQIVCPNCNATLSTHCRGLKTENTTFKNCISDGCSNKIRKHNVRCIKCHLDYLEACKIEKELEKSDNLEKKLSQNNKILKRKVERPSLEVLLKEVDELGYRAVGRKYGVSDNSIRKWIKMYKKHGLDW